MNEGFVYALPHEDDVKILRWKEKYDQIPEDTKDPGLRKAKKALKKKQPKRREGQQYWSEAQFQKLVVAPPADLASRGPLPWRLLVYMLDASPEVERIRQLVRGRLLKPNEQEAAQKALNRMLITLWRGGYVRLEPKPPLVDQGDASTEAATASSVDEPAAALTLDLGKRKWIAPASPRNRRQGSRTGRASPKRPNINQSSLTRPKRCRICCCCGACTRCTPYS